jgi:hypothetical protein
MGFVLAKWLLAVGSVETFHSFFATGVNMFFIRILLSVYNIIFDPREIAIFIFGIKG